MVRLFLWCWVCAFCDYVSFVRGCVSEICGINRSCAGMDPGFFTGERFFGFFI